MNKYVLTDETIIFNNHTLHRIQALIDIPFTEVKAGDLGGYIESEDNLSQTGSCYVFGDAKVYGHAEVSEHARVYGHAEVSENAKIYGRAEVFGNATVYRDAKICEQAKVIGYAKITKNANITSAYDYFCIGPIGSRSDYTTFYKAKDNDIWVCCGCFNGSISDFKKSVKRTHPVFSKHRLDYLNVILTAKRMLGTVTFLA